MRARRRRRVSTARRRAYKRKCFCASLERATRDEPGAEGFYGNLMENAPNDTVKAVIQGIRADEAMHGQLFAAIKKRFGC